MLTSFLWDRVYIIKIKNKHMSYCKLVLNAEVLKRLCTFNRRQDILWKKMCDDSFWLAVPLLKLLKMYNCCKSWYGCMRGVKFWRKPIRNCELNWGHSCAYLTSKSLPLLPLFGNLLTQSAMRCWRLLRQCRPWLLTSSTPPTIVITTAFRPPCGTNLGEIIW